uniref:Uncharacterized protein n=1 Tax=Cacopsylla melanoneura TaxID=428564 RepID=A0A8D9AN69_9HEMI
MAFQNTNSSNLQELWQYNKKHKKTRITEDNKFVRKNTEIKTRKEKKIGNAKKRTKREDEVVYTMFVRKSRYTYAVAKSLDTKNIELEIRIHTEPNLEALGVL